MADDSAAAAAAHATAAPIEAAPLPSLEGSAKRLVGKVIVITGSTQGLGEGIALACAHEGAEALVIIGRQEAKGAAVVEAIKAIGSKAIYVKADLTEPESIKKVCAVAVFVVCVCVHAFCARLLFALLVALPVSLAKVSVNAHAHCLSQQAGSTINNQSHVARQVFEAADDAFGRVDGLVNSAAVALRGDWYTEDIDLVDWVYKLNFRAPFLSIQNAARIMKRERRGGSIVNIGSINGHGGQSNLPAYACTKGALMTMTKHSAWALRREHIRVNYLAVRVPAHVQCVRVIL